MKELPDAQDFRLQPDLPSEKSIQLATLTKVWEYYLKKLGKNGKVLTFSDLRKKKGLRRLGEALQKTNGNLTNAEMLMRLAIDTLANSDWHMGRNPKSDGKRYDSWEDNLFRSTEQFEKWLENSR